MRDWISFSVNGETHKISGDTIFQPLSSYLRYQTRLTGTKVVCSEGDCGACTVMLAKWQPQGENSYEGVNSCIAQTFAMDGASLVTVEGLSQKGQVSEVQNSMIRNFGGQCGFCTPGFVMAITNMFEKKEQITEQHAKNYLTGNLCRCTGYAPILQAAMDVDVKKHVSVKKLYPPKDMKAQMKEPVLITTKEAEYFAPVTMQEACAYKAKYPDARIFSGATDLGVQLNKGHLEVKRFLSLHLIPELYAKKIEGNSVYIGSRVTLNEVQELVRQSVPSLDEFLNIFASPQIKNSATLVGNLANASPIADTTPVLMALDAEVLISGTKGSRSCALKDFYLGYKKLDLKPDEIVTAVRFDIPAKENRIANYKISQRRDLDISAVNASFNFVLDGNTIKSAKIAYGGMAPTTVRLRDIENKIQGKELNSELVKSVQGMIGESLNPLSDVRGSAQYRKVLALNLFEKYAKESLGL